jgi:hypothetical protein
MAWMEIARLAVLFAVVSATSFVAGFFLTKYLIDQAGGPTRAGGSCRPIFSTVTAAWRGGRANY